MKTKLENKQKAKKEGTGKKKKKTHQITRYNRIQTLRLQHHPRRHRINQHLINPDVRKLARQARRNLIPQHHPVALRIALRHHGQQLPWACLRRLERKPEDPLHAHPAEDGRLGGHFPGEAAVRATPLPRVLAFTVLAHNHPVETAHRAVAQGGAGAAEDPGRAHVSVLLEGLADGEPQAPEGNVIGDVYSVWYSLLVCESRELQRQ